MLMVAFMTLVQRRSPQAIMGRVSTAVEVVMATPQAVSVALGSALVVVLSYRQIFAIMSVVTLMNERRMLWGDDTRNKTLECRLLRRFVREV